MRVKPQQQMLPETINTPDSDSEDWFTDEKLSNAEISHF